MAVRWSQSGQSVRWIRSSCWRDSLREPSRKKYTTRFTSSQSIPAFPSWSHGDDSRIARLQLPDQESNSSKCERRRVAAPPWVVPLRDDGEVLYFPNVPRAQTAPEALPTYAAGRGGCSPAS